jgi:hypothetical protein
VQRDGGIDDVRRVGRGRANLDTANVHNHRGAEKVLSTTRATIDMVSQVENITAIEGGFLRLHFPSIRPLDSFSSRQSKFRRL